MGRVGNNPEGERLVAAHAHLPPAPVKPVKTPRLLEIVNTECTKSCTPCFACPPFPSGCPTPIPRYRIQHRSPHETAPKKCARVQSRLTPKHARNLPVKTPWLLETMPPENGAPHTCFSALFRPTSPITRIQHRRPQETASKRCARLQSPTTPVGTTRNKTGHTLLRLPISAQAGPQDHCPATDPHQLPASMSLSRESQ